MAPRLYQRDGDVFLPTAFAGSPWNHTSLHGGPVCGLLAHAAEAASPDPELQPVRLTVDLFREVPQAPLKPETQVLRRGRRIALVEVVLFADSKPVTRATVLFLRRAESSGLPSVDLGHSGPEGLETSPLVPEEWRPHMPEGFHTHVEVRWETAPTAERPAFWIRAPSPLVDEEEWTPFQRAAAISDLSNALSSTQRRRQNPTGTAFINPDTTLYLSRLPVGEWIRLSCDHVEHRDGLGLVSVVHHDERGRFGRTVQAHLENPVRRPA